VRELASRHGDTLERLSREVDRYVFTAVLENF
jgi:hypothetical protein